MTVATAGPLVAAFLAIGLFWGSWAVLVANIRHTFHLSNVSLGWLLAVAICTAGLTGGVVGHLAERWGERRMLAVALGAWSLLMVGTGIAPSLWAFAACFVACVTAGGCVDTAMNAAASRQFAGRSGSLVRFHALFNSGALIGAGVAGITLHLGASWRWLWPSFGALVAVLAIWAGRMAWAVPDSRRERTKALRPTPPRPKGLRGSVRQLHVDALVVLLLIFAFAEITEGGVDTWGVLYLRTHLAAGVLLGAGAYVAGQGIAMLTRGVGAPVIGRLSPRSALIVGGLVAGAGMLLESGSSYATIAAIGLACGAGGASLFWPIVMSDVVVRATYPVPATGAFTAAGYVGLVAGAPLIGWISDAWGLNRGLLVLASFAILVAVLSLLRRDSSWRATAGEP